MSWCSMRIVSMKREMVHPATRTPPQVLVLSDVDQRMALLGHYIFVLFYKPKPEVRLLSPASLKTSLSQTLTLYFPLAGRLKARRSGCRLHAGAWFEEAEAEGTLEDLGGVFCVKPELAELLQPSDLHPARGLLDLPQALEHALPLLRVRVTRFVCGGATLVVSLHHGLADAFSGAAFVTAWSALALGKKEVPSLLPHHDRSVLGARDPPTVTSAHPELTLVLPNFQPAAGASVQPSRMILGLQASQVAILKQRATAGTSSFTATAFEALMGLLWRSVTRARGLDGASRVRLWITVDVRRRMLLPALPPGYFGNAILSCVAETTAGELLDGLLSNAALVVHQAVGTVTDEHARSTLDFFALQGGGSRSVFDTFFPHSHGDLLVTSWKELPFYDAHFGMGRPDFVGPSFTFGFTDGFLTFMPGHRKDGGIDCSICLSHDILAKLRIDPELQDFAELR